LNNPNNKLGTFLILKFEHSLTDGLGYISLIFSLADNYDINNFPVLRRPSLIQIIKAKIIAILMFPFYVLTSFYNNLIRLDFGDTPFKVKGKFSGVSSKSISEVFSLSKFLNMAKKLKITFNDLILSMISSATKKLIKKHYMDKYGNLNKLSCLIPIGDRGIPKSLHDLVIHNDSHGVVSLLELIDDPLNPKETKKISSEMNSSVRNYAYTFANLICIRFMNTFVPTWLTHQFYRFASRKYDILVSNVPGPKTNLIYNGDEMKEIIPFTSCGYHSIFIPVICYTNKMRIGVTVENNVGLDAHLYTKFIEDEFNLILEIFEKEVNKKN